ncbi:hypothetical protein D3C78_1427030 [compost metagenome]
MTATWSCLTNHSLSVSTPMASRQLIVTGSGLRVSSDVHSLKSNGSPVSGLTCEVESVWLLSLPKLPAPSLQTPPPNSSGTGVSPLYIACIPNSVNAGLPSASSSQAKPFGPLNPSMRPSGENIQSRKAMTRSGCFVLAPIDQIQPPP